MPAFRDCIYGKEHRLSETPSNHFHNGVPVGMLIYNMRIGILSIPLSYLEELEILGLSATRKRKVTTTRTSIIALRNAFDLFVKTMNISK
jgi:hypothetical protein